MADELSRYRILGPIGAGGMGEVFLAEDERLSRKVALKLLPKDSCGDESRRRRFVQEARAAAMISHPNVCMVFDAGEAADGQVFIAMEYVEGQTLAERCRKHPLPEPELLDVAIQAADALEEAHSRGLVHRDLKPSNLMLNSRGQVKVVDFGLAKVLAPVSADDGEHSTEVKTMAGVVVGTVAYMSPEQAAGGHLDARTDVFSLGVVLYQLATGRLPFAGQTFTEIVAKIVGAEPAPFDGVAVSPAFEGIVRRCLRKARDERYPSMNALRADLRGLRDGARTGGDPAGGAPDAVPHNLPAEITSFVGRESEIADLRDLVGSHRLVTVTGAGGSGKTRLARQVALRSLGDFPGGVRLVSLDPVGPELVAQAFAEAVGVREESDRPLLDGVAASLASRSALLLVDNCEHVLAEAARVTDVLLRAAPGLRVLATSQEALGLEGEHVWSAPPLAVPAGRAGQSVEASLQHDAVHLFVDRAQARDPRFALTPANLDAVVQVCARLDGVPLAIELAAARIRAMSAADIRGRLDDCFQLLTAGARGALPRHQTLRAAVDWSHELLSGPERTLFRRLAPFRGGFDLEAVEGTAGFGDLPPSDVLDHLSRLVEKSLVVSERAADDSVRCRVLEPLRQYAAEKVAGAGEAEETARRHFAHYAELADRAYEERTARATEWVERLERDHDNLRAALDWAAGHDPDGELRLAGALAWMWQLHSHFSEGRRWLRRVLERPRGRTREAARALWGASSLAVWQGDLAAGTAPGEESLAIWRELGDKREVAMALEPIGFSRWMAADHAGAYEAFEEELAIYRELGDERLANRATLNICQVLVSESRVDEAERLSEGALALAREHGELREIHNAHHFLADCALIRGEAELAARRYAESLRAAVAYGDRFEMQYEVEGVAMAVAGLGRDGEAVCLAAAAEAEREALKSSASVAFWDALEKRYLGPAAERLGPAAAAQARAEGRALGFEAAVQRALSAPGGSAATR